MMEQRQDLTTTQRNESKKEIIECECGTHMLVVTSDTDFYEHSDGTTQIHQSIYFAMFGYGNHKDTIWRRIKIACKYLWTGEMHSDQITMEPSEAKKLSEFISENLIPTTQNPNNDKEDKK
jgi:hypothetical protein